LLVKRISKKSKNSEIYTKNRGISYQKLENLKFRITIIVYLYIKKHGYCPKSIDGGGGVGYNIISFIKNIFFKRRKL
jgi:hypothetical protein